MLIYYCNLNSTLNFLSGTRFVVAALTLLHHPTLAWQSGSMATYLHGFFILLLF